MGTLYSLREGTEGTEESGFPGASLASLGDLVYLDLWLILSSAAFPLALSLLISTHLKMNRADGEVTQNSYCASP